MQPDSPPFLPPASSGNTEAKTATSNHHEKESFVMAAPMEDKDNPTPPLLDKVDNLPMPNGDVDNMNDLPMSVVLVRSTPPSASAASRRSHDPPLSAPVRTTGDFGGVNEDMYGSAPGSAPARFSKNFRLQPRGNAVCTPSPSRLVARGRKRGAQCLATASGRYLFSPSTPNANDSSKLCLSPQAFSEKSESEDPCHGHVRPTLPPEYAASPLRMDLQSLSIQSPNVARRPVGSKSPLFSCGQSMARPPGSSFSVYSGTSSSAYDEARPNSVSSAVTKVSRPSPMSVKSAFAPIKLAEVQSSGATEISKTPTQRPPLHQGPASLLMSIENDSSTKNDVDFLLTPKEPPSVVQYAPDLSNTSSITPRECQLSTGMVSTPPILTSQDDEQSGLTPSTKQARTPTNPSPSKRTHRSPHTPLPKVKLTPRSSSGRRSNDILPRFPSPSDADVEHVDLRASDLFLVGPSTDRIPMVARRSTISQPSPPPSQVVPNTRFRPPAAQSQHESTNSLALSADGSTEGDIKIKADSPFGSKPSYLPIPEWCDAATSRQVRQGLFSASRFPTGKVNSSSNEATPQRTNTSDSGNVFPIPTKSLLKPSACGFSFVNSMMAAAQKNAASDTDGSLTDTDDDEAFVLTAPGVILEERQALGRARQRRRRSYESLQCDQHREPSSASLASSAQASNTSLQGMVWATQQDSSSAASGRESTPYSNLSSRHDSREHLQHGEYPASLSRLRSDNSLASVGLALDQAMEEQDRDFCTPPPVIPENTDGPPPRLSGAMAAHLEATAASICIPGADPQAVSMAIAKMPYKSSPLREN